MKKLINFVAIAFVAISFAACGEKDPTPPPVNPGELTLYKSWQLTNWPDAESVFPKGVYITFYENETFDLYQDVESVGYVKITGTFTFDETTKKLSGVYSDGDPWKETYTRTAMTAYQLDLLGSSGATSIFESKAIPEGITNNIAPASLAADVKFVRFL